MCGIIGYVGKREAKPLLLSGLRRLEYRGYDSAGIALREEEGLDYVRAVGKLQMTHNTRLPADHYIASNLRTATDACLRSNDRVVTNFNIVRYLYEVIELGTGADNS